MVDYFSPENDTLEGPYDEATEKMHRLHAKCKSYHKFTNLQSGLGSF